MFCNKPLIALLVASLIGSMLIVQQPMTYASKKSPYDSGYDHGCDDAGLPESEMYINQAGKGPSFHTDEFMNGYYDGFYACSGVYEEPYYEEPYYEPPQTGGINWENLCNQYGSFVGIKDPCYEYADGTQLTEKGETALVCLLGGGITLLASLDPATQAAILEAGKRYCP